MEANKARFVSQSALRLLSNDHARVKSRSKPILGEKVEEIFTEWARSEGRINLSTERDIGRALFIEV